MTASELIERIAKAQPQLSEHDVQLAVKAMLRQMRDALAAGERIEIRGFGSFCLRRRRPRIGHNPQTGEAVALPTPQAPRFRPGKELRERVTNPPISHRTYYHSCCRIEG